MTRSSEGAIYNERVQNITMHVGENNSRDWSWEKKARSRPAVYTAWRACRSSTDPRVLNGIMNDVRCLIGISPMN